MTVTMWKLACVAVLALMAVHSATGVPMAQKVQQLEKNQQNLQQIIQQLGQQLMNQQTSVEERVRSDGHSGIKSLRVNHAGTQPYFSEHHVGLSALTCHDHPDYDRTIGLGEFVAVMNGVEFRTRHNDYKLRSPSHTRKYDSVEDIPFPDVPPEVLRKPTVSAQAEELQKWFKAFKDQDHSVRDYRKYFKPNLCYLEGVWALNADSLNEVFDSDRHHLDASSWFDLMDKIRFTSYAGSKSNLENFSFLPTMMYNMTNGIPKFAQWNYRILCHPLKQDVPTHYFQVQDDLAPRMAHKWKWDRMPSLRAARFSINEYGTEKYNYYNFLDGLMAEIPGKDNYGANLTDDGFGLLNYDIKDPGAMKPLNTGMYHRWFKLDEAGAMGLTINHRGFHDENMWVAMTTQPNVMPLSINHCVFGKCSSTTRRVSYALPLEIVYSTPLSSWNPYGIIKRRNVDISANGRTGELTKAKAFNGVSYRRYYVTPSEFFQSGRNEHDPANTGKFAIGVLDPKGNVRSTSPSGFRIMTQDIGGGVGKVRLRWPIFPVHSEGTTVGKELMALKMLVQKMGRYQYLYEETPMGQAIPPDMDITFEVRESRNNPPGIHSHSFTLTSQEFNGLKNGTIKQMAVTTSYNIGHQHQMVIWYNPNNMAHHWLYKTCDGKARCWDGHANWFEIYA